MRRAVCVSLFALVLLVAAVPAWAVYGTSGGGAQPGASVSRSLVAPGQSVTVTAPAGSFLPGSSVSVYFLRIVPGEAPRLLATIAAAVDGSFGATVTIPADAATSNYLLYLQGTAPDGTVRVLTVAMVVSPGFTAAAVSSRPFASAPRSGTAAAAPSTGASTGASQASPAPSGAAGGTDQGSSSSAVATRAAVTAGGSGSMRLVLGGLVVLAVIGGLWRLRPRRSSGGAA